MWESMWFWRKFTIVGNQPKSEMAGAPSYTPTILDYLNEDCWRAVLDYLPHTDIIATERASHRWQRMVLTYLQGLRFIIHSPSQPFHEDVQNARKIIAVYDGLHSRDSFKNWTYKLGPGVVGIHCDSCYIFEVIRDNCPNLEAVIFNEIPASFLQYTQNGNFKRLQKVSFDNCTDASDRCVSQIIAGKPLEKLSINRNRLVTGKCLVDAESEKFISLKLHDCCVFESRHLLSAADRLSELTSLDLCSLPSDIYDAIPLLLSKKPMLEYLKIVDYRDHSYRYCDVICRLGSLKKLVLYVRDLTDDDLDVVTRCCTELRILDVDGGTEVTRQGVSAVYRNAGARLTALDFGLCYLTDTDVVACIRSCPNLTLLDVSACDELTLALPALATEARRELRVDSPLPLRLYLPRAYGRSLYKKHDQVIYTCWCTAVIANRVLS